ncbi:hypothetical protein C8J35_103488 [Rhizobium sp. PP-F2F-G38]|nr:hypothetical protein C8J35_103488 [Rhizobium sp. PP-F2F-G38]
MNYGIPVPPQGHWNRVHAGKPVPTPPQVLPRKPGETGRIRLDERFKHHVPSADPISANGPFATIATPESLDELYQNELKFLDGARVPKSLSTPHMGLVQLLAKDEKRQLKFEKSGWEIDRPLFQSPLAKRQLRILSGLFVALTRRGHSGDVNETEGQLHGRAIIGETYLGLEFVSTGRNPTAIRHSHGSPHRTAPSTTAISLRIRPGFDRHISHAWQDDTNGILEDKIPTIAASLIVAGEEYFRKGLYEDERRAEEARTEQEKRRQEQIKQLNFKRIDNLKTSGELLRQAREIRALVESVRQAILEGADGIDLAGLSAWEEWALEQANNLDPILSGQYLSHFHEPEA